MVKGIERSGRKREGGERKRKGWKKAVKGSGRSLSAVDRLFERKESRLTDLGREKAETVWSLDNTRNVISMRA